MDGFYNSTGWGIVLRGSRAVPVGLQRGCFTGGEGDASSMQGVEVSERVGKHVRVCVCVCVYPVLLCVCVCGCEQKAQVRDTERKDMLDLLTALWCVPPKKKRSYVTETSSEPMQVLCVCLPRSKNFLDSHPFQRKHCITPIYICNTHK